MSTIPVSDLLVCTEAATWEHQGQPIYVGPGTIVRAGNPVIKDHESHFSPLVLEVSFDPDLEPSKASVAVCGGNGDLHGFVFGCGQFPVRTWRTKPVVLV